MSVLSEIRKRIILQLLDRHGKVKSAELSDTLNVSTETIRRYILELDKQNKLKKVYGGAIKVSHSSLQEPTMFERNIINIEEKKRIAYQAARFVQTGDVILIDEGSTTLHLVNFLRHVENLTIITNSFSIVEKLIIARNNKLFNGEVIFIGGIVNAQHFRTSGLISEEILKNLSVNKAFVSVDAINSKSGLTCFDKEKAQLTKLMIMQANETYVLIDESKIGRTCTFKVTSLERVEYVVSNSTYPDDWHPFVIKQMVQWITC